MSVVAAIPPPPISGFQIGPLDLRLYGILIAVGAFLALRLTVRRFEAAGGDPAIAEKAALLALVGGFAGARIGYVIPRLDRFLESPIDILLVRQGGLVFFGGLAGGALAVFVYVRIKGVSMAAMADAVAPALPLAQAIGRWGNYFNQELYGRPTDLPWALRVEEQHIDLNRYPLSRTFHPTFLYESLWNFALVIVILWVDRRGLLKRRGSLFFVYLIGYGIGRGWIEWLRVDTVERYLGLSRNNWIAIGIVLLGIVGLMWWERRAASPLIADDGEDLDALEGADLADEPSDTDGTIDHTSDTEVADEPSDTDGTIDHASDTEVADEPSDTDGTIDHISDTEVADEPANIDRTFDDDDDTDVMATVGPQPDPTEPDGGATTADEPPSGHLDQRPIDDGNAPGIDDVTNVPAETDDPPSDTALPPKRDGEGSPNGDGDDAGRVDSD